jgi:hypothetical protein
MPDRPVTAGRGPAVQAPVAPEPQAHGQNISRILRPLDMGAANDDVQLLGGDAAVGIVVQRSHLSIPQCDCVLS